MPNWEEINQWLQPKPPPYCPEEPSLTQKVFLRTNAPEALFGGAAGGGKSSALLMAALQYVDVPGYAAILFRKTFADLALPNALMDRFREWMSNHDDVHWNNNNYIATFPSGARITFGYLNNTNDYLRYKGAEFQFMGFDEVTEIREHDYKYMFSRMRRPEIGPLSRVPLRVRAASNPAPNWVRQHFLVEGEQEGRIFVPSLFTDNPGVDHDAYRAMLSRLDTVERRQLEFGDWWVAQGGSMFRAEDFVKIERKDIPTLSPKAKMVRFWDLAATEKTKENDPDYTVGALILWNEGTAYVLDIKRERFNSREVERLVSGTAHEDGVAVAIRVEQEPGASGKSLIDQYARYVVPGYDFQGVRATGSKEVRARPMASAAKNGNVCVLEAPWRTEFLNEITYFPEGQENGVAHDDQVDAVVGGFNFVAGIAGGFRRPLEIVV